MGEITIVTAFFNIKREQMSQYNRTDKEYLEYFDDWARIKNRVIIFCDEQHKESIYNIRKKYGLEHKTEICLIDNLIKLDATLYTSISNTMNNSYFKEFMYHKENPEVINPLYNFLMCIKPLFVKTAINKYNLKGTIAWLDFGYNHGLEYYPNVEDFDFLWEFDFNPDYVHLFNLKKIPNIPIFEIIRRMNSYIQGGTLIANAKKWEEFWNITRENMLILNSVGLADDDQILFLMGYRRYPELFQMHEAYWNEAMKLYGGEHMAYSKYGGNRRTMKQKIINVYTRIVKLKRKVKYLIRTFKVLNDGEFDG